MNSEPTAGPTWATPALKHTKPRKAATTPAYKMPASEPACRLTAAPVDSSQAYIGAITERPTTMKAASSSIGCTPWGRHCRKAV